MPRLARLLLLCFLASLGNIVVGRGIYFFMKREHTFGDEGNLALATGIGLAYVLGALPSHRLAARLGERRLMLLNAAGQALAMLTMALWPTLPVLILANVAFSFLIGMFWPLAESYVTAGRGAVDTSRAVGYFNFAWSSAVVVGVAIIGSLLWLWSEAIFALGVATSLSVMALGVALEARPAHLHEDDPQRPDEQTLSNYRTLLSGGRWLLLASYATLFVLAPVMPRIMAGLAVSVWLATLLYSLIDLCRFVAFLGMRFTHRWHGRGDILMAAALIMPASFFVVLGGEGLRWVIPGLIVFGLAQGVIYYAALYYAMVVQNASVEGGGTHEALIGMGFTLGPLTGLAGALLPMAGERWGPMLGATPLLAVCVVGALAHLARLGRAR